MLRKKFFNLIFLPLLTLFLLSAFFVSFDITKAQTDDPYGVDDMDIYLEQDIGPREAIVNIINLALSFLGLIAVIIVIYGGFVWMTSGGDADKVNNAKKILKNGLIGLIIVLLSWGIVTWVLAQFPGIIGGGDVNGSCTPGHTQTRFLCIDTNGNSCNEIRHCLDSGTWGSWSNSCNCADYNGNGGTTGDSCDGDPNVSGCLPNHDICSEGYYCSSDTCTCQPQGGLGDPCDAEPETDACSQPDHDLCGSYLTCNDEECICEGPPVITSVSPMGGFCENDINEPCLSDNDCPASSCNTSTPNGAPNNFLTILGHNFGNQAGRVLFNDLEGSSPSNLNNECINTWSNNQIIIAVPNGASNGPITVEADSGKTGSTNDDLGPQINDFVANNINRPGLCLVDPGSGILNTEISYQGINLFNANAYFGSYEQRVEAIDSDLNNQTYGTAKVPNVGAGQVTTFALGTVSGFSLYSNYLEFNIEKQEDPGPYINSFSPEEGAPGQYVSIYGGGFGNTRGNNQVYFGNTEANYSFPEVCLHSVWSNNKIIVKVPENAEDGNHLIEIQIANEEINTSLLNPDQFEVNSSLDLSPSLCKMSPIRGQANTQVTFWGEYFGDYNNPISAIFHNNEVVNSEVEKDGSTDYFSAQVPSEAVSGPVSVRRDGLDGNSLNFEIGPCQSDADCGAQICCPSDTYEAFRCADNLNECSIDIPSSVFEWSFDTDLDNLDFCLEIEDKEACFQESECCFDAHEDQCVTTNNREVFSDEEEDNFGYCKRWNCEVLEEEEEVGPCDFENPLSTGEFETQNICALECGDSDIGNPGVSCAMPDADTCNFSGCSGNIFVFNCLMEDGGMGSLPNCGVCCCDPNAEEDTCADINEILHCQPDQDPCTGDNRGLCCGCINDDHCGSIETTGCGSDTCCRERPEVVENDMFPQDGQEDVCRNTMISIPFNQKMNINSLRTNILVLEERVLGDYCPGGSMVLNKNIERNQNFFARLFNNIKNSYSRLFSGISSTALATPDSNKLYCLIPGTTQVKQEAERSVLNFYPRNLLRDDTNYYIVIKGDEDLDSQSGVLSAWDIGMNGTGYDSDDSVKFNEVSFTNSFISKFTTLDDQSTNSGVCEIAYVGVSPSSYLFNTTENDINENDNNSIDPTFDTKRDKDKVFHATAYTIDAYPISSTLGYSWNWRWIIGDNSIIEEKSTNPPLLENQFFAKARSDVTDASTYLEAIIDMEGHSNFNMEADGISGQADITVFVCRNPWPAFLPGDENWSPWQDDDYNYKFYYCRDDGSLAYVDDLPALIHPAVESGPSSQMLCSSTNQPCTNEEIEANSCGPDNRGICVWSVLKESYFFRQTRPSAGIITNGEDTETGGEVRLSWSGSSDLIYHSDPNLRGHYRIYYAKDGNGFSYIDVNPSNSCTHNSSENEYNCSHIVSDLENDELYIFRVSAVSRTKVEIFFSNEVKVIPTDKTPPSAPLDCGYTYIYNEIDEDENDIKAIEFKCTGLDDDVAKLRMYHGTSSGNYGQYFESDYDDDVYSIELNVEQFSVWPNYFAVSALDKYGNESEKSAEIVVNID